MTSTPAVEANVKIIPAKRSATFDVPIGKLDPKKDNRGRPAPRLRATVNLKSITFGASSDIPKTLAAADAIIALAEAVRAELVEQGVTE